MSSVARLANACTYTSGPEIVCSERTNSQHGSGTIQVMENSTLRLVIEITSALKVLTTLGSGSDLPESIKHPSGKNPIVNTAIIFRNIFFSLSPKTNHIQHSTYPDKKHRDAGKRATYNLPSSIYPAKNSGTQKTRNLSYPHLPAIFIPHLKHAPFVILLRNTRNPVRSMSISLHEGQ